MKKEKSFGVDVRRIITLLLIIVIISKGETIMQTNDKELIKSVIEKAYIEGIHTTQDENTIRSGFHKDFAMLVYKNDGIEEVTIDIWLKRIEQMKKDNPKLWIKETRYDSIVINVTGYAASVQLVVYKGDTYFSTDYMLLYKFKNGWKIVSKIFTISKS